MRAAGVAWSGSVGGSRPGLPGRRARVRSGERAARATARAARAAAQLPSWVQPPPPPPPAAVARMSVRCTRLRHQVKHSSTKEVSTFQGRKGGPKNPWWGKEHTVFVHLTQTITTCAESSPCRQKQAPRKAVPCIWGAHAAKLANAAAALASHKCRAAAAPDDTQGQLQQC